MDLGRRDEPDSTKISVEIRASSILSANSFKLHGVRTAKRFGLLIQSLDVRELKGKYDYIRGLPILIRTEKAIPKILMGIDNYEISVLVEIG